MCFEFWYQHIFITFLFFRNTVKCYFCLMRDSHHGRHAADFAAMTQPYWTLVSAAACAINQRCYFSVINTGKKWRQCSMLLCRIKPSDETDMTHEWQYGDAVQDYTGLNHRADPISPYIVIRFMYVSIIFIFKPAGIFYLPSSVNSCSIIVLKTVTLILAVLARRLFLQRIELYFVQSS